MVFKKMQLKLCDNFIVNTKENVGEVIEPKLIQRQKSKMVEPWQTILPESTEASELVTPKSWLQILYKMSKE